MSEIKIPETIKRYLTDKLYAQKVGHIKLCFVKEVIAPVVNRSDDSEDVITFRNGNREIVAINSRKLKSKDKLFGLQLARNNGGTQESARYNEMQAAEDLANINSILYGDTAVGDNAKGLKARCYYDWSYSIRDYNEITEMFQHNSITESGTIVATQDVGTQKKGELRKNALFSTKYILPNTYFPHFITLMDCTEDMFLHALFTMLQSKAYGGQTTAQGSITMKNHLVAIVAGKYELPLNSLVISNKFTDKEEFVPTVESLSETIIDELGKVGYKKDKNLVVEEELNNFISKLKELFADEEWLTGFYKRTKEGSEEFLKTVGLIKPEKKK